MSKKKIALTVTNDFIKALQTTANEYYQGLITFKELKKELDKINDNTMDDYNAGRLNKEQLQVYMKTVDDLNTTIKKERGL